MFATENVDVRLRKDLPVAGPQRVGLQVDVFNVFNTTNYTFFDASIYGVNANFGHPTDAAEGRRLQVGLRYDFGGSQSR